MKKLFLLLIVLATCTVNSFAYTPDATAEFDFRYDRGKESGKYIKQKIIDGKIKIKRDALGRIAGKIDIVAHSMGYAYSKGMLDELKDILAFNNKFGNYYIIAPENAIGHPTSTEPLYRLNTSDFESVFQYGSNFEEEDDCYQDGIAPQVKINGLPDGRNIFIPMTKDYKYMRKFLPAHQIKNYGWLFTEPSIPFEARIKRRNN